MLAFLKHQGYTHIQLQGIETKAESNSDSPDEPNDNFIVVPWKEGIAFFEDASMPLEKIDSTDVTDRPIDNPVIFRIVKVLYLLKLLQAVFK